MHRGVIPKKVPCRAQCMKVRQEADRPERCLTYVVLEGRSVVVVAHLHSGRTGS